MIGYLRGEGNREPTVPSLRALSSAANDSSQAQPHEATSPNPSSAGQKGGRTPGTFSALGLPSLSHTHHAWTGQCGGLNIAVGMGPSLPWASFLCECSPCCLSLQGTRAVSTPSKIASPMVTATGLPSQQPVETGWPRRPTVSTRCGPMATTASVHLYLPQVSPLPASPERLPRANPVLGALCTLPHSLGTAL